MHRNVSRKDRLNRELMRALATIVHLHVQDKRLQQMTITRVAVTADLRDAKVYFTTFGDLEETKKALERAQGFFRSEIATRLKLRIIPQFHFFYDDTLEKIELLQRKIEPPAEEE